MKLYNKLEGIVGKYIVKPLATIGLVGVLSYSRGLYTQDIFVSRGGGWYGQDIAMNNEGKFVATWNKNDNSGFGVYAKRFDQDGNRIGEEFRVNAFTDDDQRRPAIAMNDNGNFVITWESDGQDGSSFGIYAKRFDQDGNRIGEEFRVNDYTEDGQYNPAITIDHEGNFILAWISYDGSGFGVYAKRFDKDGNRIGEEFKVGGTYVSALGNDVDISSNYDKDFAITWANSWDGHVGGISAQRFDKDGNRIGEEFQVNTLIEDDQYNPVIAMNNERFVVTWTSDGQYPFTFDTYAQRFDQDGNRIGEEFRVNDYALSHQEWPDIALNKRSGDYIITWSSGGQDGSGFGVYAQRFDQDGNRTGEEFQVNSYAEGNQWHSRITMNDGGDFVIIWYDGEEDGSGKGAYAKVSHFSDVFFRRGDANRDKEYDISDPVSTLFHLFSDLELKCLDAADTNDDGKLDVSDPVYSLNHLFLGGQAPPFPYPWPGKDYTQDNLDCREY